MVRIVNSPLTAQPIAEKRSVSTLAHVGANADAVRIVGRQDGIIANQPRDGFISADEIAASLQSPHVDLLSSAEVDALRGAASLLEVRLKQPTLKPFVQGEPLTAFVSQRVVEPQLWPSPTFSTATPLSFETGISFGDMGRVEKYLFKDKDLLVRVQRVANNDANQTTASIDDLHRALATHGSSFTPHEVKTINEMIVDASAYLQTEATYAARHNKPVTPDVGSRVDVRGSTSTTQELARMGQVRVGFSAETKSTFANDEVTVSRTRSHWLQVPDGHMCVVNNGNSGDGEVLEDQPTVYGPGRHPMNHARFEVQTWKNGAIQRTDKVDIKESFAVPDGDAARSAAALTAADSTLSPGTLSHHVERQAAIAMRDSLVVGDLRGHRVFIDGAEQPSTYNRLNLTPGIFQAGPFTITSQGNDGPTFIDIPGVGRRLMDNLDEHSPVSSRIIEQLGVEIDLPAALRGNPLPVKSGCTGWLADGPVKIAMRAGSPDLYVHTKEGWAQLEMKQLGAGSNPVSDGAVRPTIKHNPLALPAAVYSAHKIQIVTQGDKGPAHLVIAGFGQFELALQNVGSTQQLGVAVNLPPGSGWRTTVRPNLHVEKLPATGPVEFALRADGAVYAKNAAQVWVRLKTDVQG